MKKFIIAVALIITILVTSSIFVFFSFNVVPPASAYRDSTIIKDENSEEQCSTTCLLHSQASRYIIALGGK